MYGDINLVADKESSASSKSKLKKIRSISYLVLFLVTISSVLIFILNIRYSVNSVREQQTSVLNNLSIYNESVVKLIFLNQRLADIKVIFEDKTNYQELLTSFFSTLPPSVTIESYDINEGKFNLTLSSESLLALNESLNTILSTANDQGISDVVLSSLTNSSSSYLMAVSMTLPL